MLLHSKIRVYVLEKTEVMLEMFHPGEALKAKWLVSKFGEHGSYIEELMQGLVSSGELSSAIEISNGALAGCSEEMKMLIAFLGGNSDQLAARQEVEIECDMHELEKESQRQRLVHEEEEKTESEKRNKDQKVKVGVDAEMPA